MNLIDVTGTSQCVMVGLFSGRLYLSSNFPRKGKSKDHHQSQETLRISSSLALSLSKKWLHGGIRVPSEESQKISKPIKDSTGLPITDRPRRKDP